METFKKLVLFANFDMLFQRVLILVDTFEYHEFLKKPTSPRARYPAAVRGEPVFSPRKTAGRVRLGSCH